MHSHVGRHSGLGTLRVGLIGAMPESLLAGGAPPPFELVGVGSAERVHHALDAVVVGWREGTRQAARILRRDGYRRPIIAGLPAPCPREAASALSSGFDDAQPLPLDPVELAARIRAVTAGMDRGPGGPRRIVSGRLSIGADGSDPLLDGRPLKVSPNCAKVLAIVAGASRPVPLPRIVHALYGAEPPPSNTVNTYLCVLRSMLLAATGEPGWLARSGDGYVLVGHEAEADPT